MHGSFVQPDRRLLAHGLLVAWLLLFPVPMLAQGDPRASFLETVGAFSLALDGRFGDEGGQLTSAVAAMADALARWDETIRAYERGMAADLAGAGGPLAARMHVALGTVYLERGRTADALREFAAARSSDPSRNDIAGLERQAQDARVVQEVPGVEPFLPPAAYRPAFAHLHRGDLQAFVAQARTELAKDPLLSPAAARWSSAAAAFRDGRAADAIQQLEALIAREPGLAEAHRVLGLASVADGNIRRGIDELRTAIDLNPTDERARLNLAEALESAGDSDPAEQVLRATLAALPDSGRAHYQLALIYQRQGRAADAIAALRSARAALPLLGANTIDRMLGALNQSQQNLEAAAAAFSAAVARVPSDAKTRVELGQVFLLQGEHDKARAQFEAAIQSAPAHLDAHVALGQVHLREGRNDEAATAARRALELDASHREARYLYATALIRSGSAEEGARQMQEYQRLQAQEDEARSRIFELGRVRREAAVARAAGNHTSAIALLRQALVLDPTSPTSHLELGRALLAARESAEAIERLTTAAALNAPPEVYRDLADAYAALGQAAASQQARSTYEQRKRDAIRQMGRSR